jgi:hypothetical protein
MPSASLPSSAAARSDGPFHPGVIPAQAGTQGRPRRCLRRAKGSRHWIPAFAGMTAETLSCPPGKRTPVDKPLQPPVNRSSSPPPAVQTPVDNPPPVRSDGPTPVPFPRKRDSRASRAALRRTLGTTHWIPAFAGMTPETLSSPARAGGIAKRPRLHRPQLSPHAPPRRRPGPILRSIPLTGASGPISGGTAPCAGAGHPPRTEIHDPCTDQTMSVAAIGHGFPRPARSSAVHQNPHPFRRLSGISARLSPPRPPRLDSPHRHPRSDGCKRAAGVAGPGGAASVVPGQAGRFCGPR